VYGLPKPLQHQYDTRLYIVEFGHPSLPAVKLFWIPISSSRSVSQRQPSGITDTRSDPRGYSTLTYVLVLQTLNDKHFFFFISANALRAPSYDLSRHTR
jgi:hypothetical protein